MKKMFITLLAVTVAASVASASEGSLDSRVSGLQSQIDGIMAKAGIQFSGEFRSQFLSSTLDDGNFVDSTKKTNESVMFTSVDFDITARPNTSLTARAMFRMHQDWRNFFGDVQNPVVARWVSIDGSIMDGIVKYNLGDYRKKLTPLTLWSPDLELMFEPEIFAEGRRYSMSEAFLGENNRVLQGGNIEFKAGFGMPAVVEASVFGARLAVRGTYESGVTPPGIGAPGEFTAADGVYWDKYFDKYLIGADFGAQIFDGLGLGATYLHIYDALTSYNGPEDLAKLGFNPDDGTNSPAQSTGVFAVRLNADTRVIGMDDPLNVGLNFEMALSSDKKYYPQGGGAVAPSSIAADSTENGMALNAGLSVKFAMGEEDGVNLTATFMMNDKEFRNDAAQSPSFLPTPIINSENIRTVNPFDAMYRSVFKFAPSAYFGNSRAYAKNSYGNAILTPGEYGQVNSYLPMQAALPGGLATADRVGPVIDLSGRFLEGGVKVGARAAMLNTNDKLTGLEWSYTEMGGPEGFDEITSSGQISDITPEFFELIAGVSVDVAKFAPVVGPSLEIGVSFGMYNNTDGMTIPVPAEDRPLGVVRDIRASKVEAENTLIGVGLNYQFHRRFSFLAGYQMLTMNTTANTTGGNFTGKTETETVFTNMSFGFGYRVADGGVLTAKISQITGDFGNDMTYSAWQPELFLTVRF